MIPRQVHPRGRIADAAVTWDAERLDVTKVTLEAFARACEGKEEFLIPIAMVHGAAVTEAIIRSAETHLPEIVGWSRTRGRLRGAARALHGAARCPNVDRAMNASLHDRCRTPRRSVRSALGAIAVAAACWGSAAAQSDRQEYLRVDDARPMAAALEMLMRYGTIITYEDPRYWYAADIKDVTREVRKDLDRFPPGQAPKVLVPRGGRLDFKYSVSAASGKPEDFEPLLAALIETHTARGRGARFRFERVGDVYHVFPAEIRNTAGRWVNTASILDAYITVPEQELTKVGIVEAVVAAIGEAMNVRFVVATCLECGPRAWGPVPTQKFAVNNEKARDVLWRALQNSHPGTHWRIFQQPGTDQYFFNVTHTAAHEPAAAPAMPPPRDDNPARCRPTDVRCPE